MIGREKRVLLRHYLEQGMNKAVIARDLGVSRRTVYHWIETGQLDRELDEERVGYGPRCLMPSKLDPQAVDRHASQGEPGVHALRLPLELQDPSVPTLSGSDQGQGGAADPLPQGELLLRAHLHVGRRSQRAGPSLA